MLMKHRWITAKPLGSSVVMTLVFLLQLWTVLEVPRVSALSGCQRCDQTGDCSEAYLGGPGQFCGHWLDRANQRQSCCCPTNAVCRVANYACNCAYSNGRDRQRHGYDPLLWLWWLLGALAIAFCCGSCLYMLFGRRQRRGFDGDDDGASPVPLAYPVGAPPATPTSAYGATGGGSAPAAYTQNYGTAPPLYATPGYAAPVYASGGGGGGGGGYSNRQSRMGAGTGAALGGTAGLLGGLLLGQAIADAGDGGFGGGGFGGAGDGGGGGGFDAGVGDFGGDF